MTLDKEEHRNVLMQLIETANIAGNALDTVYELKQSVMNAVVSFDDSEEDTEE